MQEIMDGINWDQVVDYAFKVVGVLVFLLIAWIIAGWIRRLVRNGLQRAKVDLTLTKFFSNFARYTLLILALVSCLEVFGVQTASFAAVLAAAGFAIGLAFQGTLGNFSAGVMLLVFRPFKVGDVVTVGGTTGKVDEVELFVTKLDTPDNRRVIIPNGSVFGATIENRTFHDIRRVDVAVGTDYGADLSETRAVLERVAAGMEGQVKDSPPQVYLVNLGDSSINWEVRVWSPTVDYFAMKERLTYAVKTALDDAGIGIPFPQMDVHLDGELGG